MPLDKLQKLKELMDVLDKSISRDEFSASFKQVLDFVKSQRDNTSKELQTIAESVKTAISRIESSATTSLSSAQEKVMAECHSEMADMMAKCDAKMAEMKDGMDGENGMDADEEKMMEQMKSEMMPPMLAECIDSVEKNLPELGYAIRDSLELIDVEEEKLDISAIKNLRKELDELRKSVGGRIVGGASHMSTVQTLIMTTASTVDNSNVTFDFGGQKPQMVNVNGAFYAEGHGWAFTSSNVVLDVPVGTGGHIFGLR